jgi:hypothetical protein
MPENKKRGKATVTATIEAKDLERLVVGLFSQRCVTLRIGTQKLIFTQWLIYATYFSDTVSTFRLENIYREPYLAFGPHALHPLA